MAKKVTIKDVAKASGVSIATVSQILNGNTKNFSPKTVEKVKAIKEKMNYEADYFARRMIMKESKTIGVMVPDITNPFFSTLVRGIEDVLYQDNFIPMLCNIDKDYMKENNALEELSRRGVDGFIIATSAISNEDIDLFLRKNDHPFIILDQKSFEEESDTIGTDDFTGGELAANHLKELGHKKVVVIVPHKMTTNINRRFEGFMSIYGDDATVISTALSKQGGKDSVSEIVKTPATAVFAINDELAFGLYLGFREIGKRVPEDYSVIGYDNIEMSEYVTPALTTVAQPIVELGQTAAEMLLTRIKDPKLAWQHTKLPVKLIKRFSTTHA
ncbi:ribose utilization transcriptional repressor RbsR [Vagococcus silagei]|uniref:LacI family transcriptional regulator n=1 Tax=Vagococcus silagei TaxID=2508885 RepID=A0A4S3B523_9ENTE|nr:LacI family DNA-binding transcriptional regulator [Vagococcus silagei]THB60940.1 LacI family transcriptional regulator [Vagococcus silagei]